MDEEERIAFDGKPLFDVIQAVWVNLFLLGVYALLLIWAVLSVILIVVFVNLSWPLSLALACASTTFLVHFGILATGVVLVRGFEPYPVAPKPLYQFVDLMLGILPVLILVRYSQDSGSSTTPLIGSFLISVCLVVTVHKVVLVARGVMSNERDRITGALI